MVAIVHGQLLMAAVIFYMGALIAMYHARRSEEEFGEFSVGLNYRDLFVLLIALVPFVAGVTYIMMAFGLGFLTVDGREIAFIRYFEWSVTTPLLLFGLGILAQDDRLTVDMVMLDVVLVLLVFIASVTAGPQRQMTLIALTAVLAGLLYTVAVRLKSAIAERQPTVRRLASRLRLLVLVGWPAAVLFWVPSVEGYAMLGFDATLYGFMAVDLVIKLGYSAIVLFGLHYMGTVPIMPDMD